MANYARLHTGRGASINQRAMREACASLAIIVQSILIYALRPTGRNYLHLRASCVVGCALRWFMTALFGSEITPADAFRFAQYVEVVPGGCWPWRGSVGSAGYGSFRIDDNVLQAHRVANAIFLGPFSSDLHILHSCDNPLCCNPDHHIRGSHALNMHDMARKLRNRTPRPGNGRQKIADTEYSLIAEYYKADVAISAIARLYDVTPTAIRHILKKIGVHK